MSGIVSPSLVFLGTWRGLLLDHLNSIVLAGSVLKTLKNYGEKQSFLRPSLMNEEKGYLASYGCIVHADEAQYRTLLPGNVGTFYLPEAVLHQHKVMERRIRKQNEKSELIEKLESSRYHWEWHAKKTYTKHKKQQSNGKSNSKDSTQMGVKAKSSTSSSLGMRMN